MQAVIDYNIIPALVRMLETEDFDIRKECAWAISNATSGGDDLQIKYLVDQVFLKRILMFFKIPEFNANGLVSGMHPATGESARQA